MKLIVGIVDDQDVEKVMAALTEQRIGVTRVSSTGGLFSPGNSTLLIGVEDGAVQQVMKIIGDTGGVHTSFVPYAQTASMPVMSYIEVQVGGSITFVLDIDRFEQV